MAKDAMSDLIRAQDVGAFDRWTLPSFDPEEPELPAEPEPEVEIAVEPEPVYIEEVPVEAVTPLTLEEVEAIRQDAYNEGFQTGERDGFHAGQLKARQEAETALSAKLAQLESVMNQLFDPIAQQDEQIEEGLIHIVKHLCEQVIRRELQADSSQIKFLLQQALKLLPMGANNIRIYVHPNDFELVKELRARHEESWRILEDEALLPGGCRIETEHSFIDASVETRLEQAIAQLVEQRREQITHPHDPDLIVEFVDDQDA